MYKTVMNFTLRLKAQNQDVLLYVGENVSKIPNTLDPKHKGYSGYTNTVLFLT